MAAYFHGSSEIQADGLQTLYLMNPNYVGYSDTQQPTNMLFLNSATAGNALSHPGIPHAPPGQAQHYVGIPLQANSDDHSRQSMHEIHGVIPRFHYNLWGGSGDQTVTHIPTATPTSHSSGTADVGPHMGFRRPVVSSAQQGLSLSLSSQQPGGCRSLPCDQDLPMHNPVAVISPRSGENIRTSGGGGSPSSVSAVSNGIFGMKSVILGSKYLKAAQQLLDEVVNVGKAIKADTVEVMKEKAKMSKDSTVVAGDTSSGGESSKNRGAELTAAQRQELQMKKAKLISMLDEVEQRYRQYHQQMQMVVTSFEQASCMGSAKSYTALALQTISKQFRCLKDAILGQIKATSKNLGEDQDAIGGKVEGSRLKFVDHHLRQQRAIQQLGMMQHNAWRPQRGLPERAVSVLRAWLFEHFLHPYPKDSDKHLLAKQAGLTRSQVSNWFINARVRLWKPMVEEMYLEETKGQEQIGNSEKNVNKGEASKDPGAKSTAGKEGNAVQMDQISKIQSKNDNQVSPNASPTEISTSTVTTSPTGGSNQARVGFALIGTANMEGITQRSSKKPRNDMQHSASSISVDMDMKSGETGKGINEKFSLERQTRDSFQLIADTSSHANGFGVYPIGEIGRFNPEQLATGFHGNGVSLTLGLPHCETLPLSGNQQTYLSNQNIQLGTRLEMGTIETHYSGINTPQVSHSNNGFDSINMQNRKRFAAQLLPDFVA